jgi:Spy/CpxP family protein refolding chaperone
MPATTVQRFLAPALLLTSLVLAAGAVLAHDGEPDPARAQARLQEAMDRLDLTADQKASLKPVLEQHVADLKNVRAKYPAEPTREQRREMFREMRPLRDGYESEVREVLTDEQEKEWQEMRREARDRMREHRGEHRDQTSTPSPAE